MKFCKKVSVSILALLLLVTLSGVIGCSAKIEQSKSEQSKGEAPVKEGKPEKTKVNIGIQPYPMFMLFPVAHELGIDKEFGLEFDVKEFPATVSASQGLVRGDVDIMASAYAHHLASIKGAPQIKGFSSLGYFKGFIFVGRKGKVKPYDQLEKELGVEAAKEARLKEFKGKTFNIIPQIRPLLTDTLSQVGLKIEDVKVQEFADDPKAALVFMQGNGDFYIGSLPEEQKLLKMSDRFVNAGGDEVFGPAGLWYDIMVSTDSFMKDNPETALRTLAVIYKTVNLFDKDRNKFAEIAAARLSKLSGSTFPVQDYIGFQTVYDDFLSLDEVEAGMYNPDSKLYWKLPAAYNIRLLIEQGNLDKGVTPEAYYGDQEKLFKKLLVREDLVNKINDL